MAGDANARS